MIYLFHGADSFQIHRAVEAIKQRLDTPEKLLDSNTVVLDGATVTPQELMQHATALAFLAPARLVIVDGLVAALGAQMAGRGRKKAGQDDPLAPWQQALTQLGAGALPESTTLIFVEGDLVLDRRDSKKRMSPALPPFEEIAQATEYEPIKDKEVASWVREQVKSRDGLTMNERAVSALVEAVGSDLWTLYNELDKLETYAAGEAVDENTVRALVAQSRETKLWDLTDAVVGGNERKVMDTLAKLLDEGEPAPLISSMVARQYRQIAIVKELSAKRAGEAETGRAAGVPGWKVKSIAALASRYSWDDLRRAYALLVDADLSVKRGLQDDGSALQLLLHELCDIAPKAAPRRAPAR